jgi:hypothetical protein
MQETRRFKPSTVSRRFSVTAGFYRTCVIGGILEHAPAGHVRRPKVAAESPALGFTHLPFEALLTAARQSPDPCDFAPVAMLGLPGLRIFEATSATSPAWATSTATGCCAGAAKAPRSSWYRCRQPSAGPSTGQPQTASRGRYCSTAAAPGWTGTRPPAACAGSQPPASRPAGHTRTCPGIRSPRPCSTQASACAMSRSPPVTPTRAPRSATTGPARILDRHPNYILAALMAPRHLTPPASPAARAAEDALHCR